MKNKNTYRQEIIGVSISPTGRKMEFELYKGFSAVKSDVCPALTAHDDKSPPCVWIIEYED